MEESDFLDGLTVNGMQSNMDIQSERTENTVEIFSQKLKGAKLPDYYAAIRYW